MVKFCSVALALLVASCAIECAPSENDVDAAWGNFLAHHPIKPNEIAKRKANFAKTHAMIKKHNKNKNATFQMEHNKFSVMDKHEKQRYIGVRPIARPEGTEYFDMVNSTASMRQLPSSLDYRDHKCMPAVKDQGGCGSCWAFTAITPVEFAQCMRTDTPVRLSEQQVVDCDTENGGCEGGWYTSAWEYLMNGSAEESLYPYTGEDETCKYDDSMMAAKVSSYVWVKALSPTAMKNALVNYGPLSVAIAVVDSFFSFSKGVYTDSACDGEPINHGVVVVGWGTLNGIRHWICRNSWGIGWGRFGYFRMERGVNKCQIEGFPTAITSVV